jgi:hypothetical protein
MLNPPQDARTEFQARVEAEAQSYLWLAEASR